MTHKRNLSKEKIVLAALELANDIGVRELTFPKLAAKLGIKYPSLYNHYANMEEVRDDMAARLYRALNEEIGQALIGKSRGEAIRLYADSYRRLAMTYRGSYELLASLQQSRHEPLHAESSRHGAMLTQILEGFAFDRATLINKSRFLRSAIHGYISLNLLGFLQTDREVPTDDSYRQMIADFIALCERSAETPHTP